MNRIFTEYAKPKVSVADLKDGDTSVLLKVSIDTGKVLNEWKCKCHKTQDTYVKYYWKYSEMKPSCPDEIIKYAGGNYSNLDELGSITCLSSENDEIHPVVKDVIWGDDFAMFIVFNEENKEKFVEWLQTLDDAYWDKMEKQINKEWSDRAKSAAAWYKAQEEEKRAHRVEEPKVSTKDACFFGNLYSAVLGNSNETYKGFDSIAEKIKDVWNVDLSEKQFNKIFGKYKNKEFTGYELSNNGYEGAVEMEFYETWGDQSYLDCLSGYLLIDEESNLHVAWGTDVDGIVLVMFEDDGDNNLLLMG